ncbi:choloylglycine hydrolase family protein [Lactococcus allomyrinae]|uniref:Linear amide C-N hydrolase n=1 Tax=Lactococcus allomyrinae TaxID=2419773 RepID=A0A387BP91_9LACT|nr:choloylglycine hydrolase family protein [Lactococcus allomyrinae]AYG00351.1 linear amide C-N hydrolase [Lactococcus allomyrinae]
MCTSFQMKSSDGSLLFARTMDWHTFSAEPLVLPKNYTWRAVYDGNLITNLYTILGVGRDSPEHHADISDGINEFGLAAQKLTFSNHSEYSVSADRNKIQLAAFEFVMWILGNCQSVADIREKIKNVQLMTDDHAKMKYGRNDLHFSATDPTGQMINIEPREGKLVIIDNPIGVVTNAPKFEREVEKLATYMDLSEQAVGLNHISTGNFSGKPVFPGGFTPTSRFIRAAIFKERAILPTNEQENVIETWHILNGVTVPKSDGRSDTYTVYRSAVDVTSRRLYLQRYNDLSITSYRFPE